MPQHSHHSIYEDPGVVIGLFAEDPDPPVGDPPPNGGEPEPEPEGDPPPNGGVVK